jgi:hypothetical protein
MFRKAQLSLALVVLALAARSARAIHVDIELSLLVDVSSSIDDVEYGLQRQGYASAFTNPTFFSSVIGTGHSVAVNFIEWSGPLQQHEQVGWTLIDSQASATSFGNAIAAANRQFAASTAPGSAINFAYPRIFSNSFTSDKQVIDVSGDGPWNSGDDTLTARNAALAAGVDQINGLVILNADEPTLLSFYQNNIQGGLNSFVLAAADFNDFGDAIQRKLQLEIGGGTVPLPTTAGLGVAGLVLLGASRRRSR